MKNKNEALEYVYLRSQFYKSLWTYLGLWVVIRFVRVLIYLQTGEAYEPEVLVNILIYLSGIVFGLAIKAVIVYRKSTLVLKNS